MSYYRESFEYQPIKLFLNSNSADIIQSRGDISFNLRRNISLPSGVTGYVSLNELTIPNTYYNINSTNNKLNLQVIKNNTNAITQFKDALNAAFDMFLLMSLLILSPLSIMIKRTAFCLQVLLLVLL